MSVPGTMVRPVYRLYQLAWTGLDWLFPPLCGGCGQNGSRWCLHCQQATAVGLRPGRESGQLIVSGESTSHDHPTLLGLHLDDLRVQVQAAHGCDQFLQGGMIAFNAIVFPLAVDMKNAFPGKT